MPVFGKYQTTRELYRVGGRVLYAARRQDGSGAGRFAVKAQEPGAAFWDEEGQRAGAQALIQAARLQQQVVASGAPHWAPIHDYGSTAGGQGAYYVTDYYPRSVENLVSGRVRVDGRDLYFLLDSVLQGLRELSRACDRPHGNLESSNLLVEKGSAGSRPRAVLTDPLPDSELRPAEHAAGDLRAFGRLIYQLVLHRELQDLTAWPVEPTPEWERLGDRHAEWLELCNKLVQPTLPADLQSLDDLEAALERLFEGRRIMPRRIGAGVVALAVVAFAVWFAIGRGREEPEEAANDWDWFGPVCKSVQDRGEQWSANAWLNQNVVTPISDARALGTEFGPDTISGLEPEQRAVEAVAMVREAIRRAKTSWPLAEEMENFAAACDKLGWQATGQRVRGHLENLRLCPELATAAQGLLALSDARERWNGLTTQVETLQNRHAFLPPILPLLVREVQGSQGKGTEALLSALRDARGLAAALQEGAETLAARLQGTDGPPARYLRAGLEQGVAAGLDGVVRELKGLTEDATLVEQVVRRWKRVEELQTAVADAGTASNVGSAYSAYAAREVQFRGEGLSALKERLEAAESIGQQLKDFLEGDWKRVAEDLFLPRERELLSSAAAPDDFRKWLAEARDYYRLSVDLEQLAKLWNEKLDAAEKEINDGIQLGLPESQKLKEELPQFREAIQAFAELEPIARNEEVIRRNRDELSKEVDDFLAEVPPVMPPAEWLQAARSKQRIAGSDAINSEWRRRRDQILQDATADQLAQNRTRYIDLRTQMEKLEKALTDAEQVFPRLAALPAGRGWKDGLRAALPAEREAAIAGALQELKWGNGEPVDTQPVRRRAAAFEQFQTQLQQLVADFEQLERLLSLGYRSDEVPPGQGKSIAGIADVWRGHGVLERERVAAAVAPVLQRVDALGAADASEAPAQLLELVETSGRPELVVTAWRRLDELSWPATVAGLRKALELRERAQRFISGLPDARRSEELQAEDRAARPDRWLRCFARLRRHNEMAAALGMREQFDVDDEQLPGWALYDALLYDLYGAATGAELSEQEARRRTQAFLAQVGDLPGAVTDAGPVNELVDDLRELVDAEKPGEAPPLGPRKAEWADWQVDDSRFPESVAYSWTGAEHRLTFLRVEPAGAPPAYLSVREVSVSLFADALGSADAWSAIKQHLDPRTTAQRKGPRAWEWDGERIVTGSRWLTSDPEWTADYPNGLTVTPPRDECSMHWITARGAARFAGEVMNCRLPTPEEWTAAYGALANAAISPEVWNLRDDTYARQWQYVSERVQREMVRPRYPNEGAYAPSGAAPGAEGKALSGNDGVLWFEQVDAARGDPFRHLIGNVAEFLSDGEGDYYVVGGSALSSPDITAHRPVSLSPRETSMYYSDVGFRLAVSPTGESFTWGLRGLLRRRGRYLRSDLGPAEGSGGA